MKPSLKRVIALAFTGAICLLAGGCGSSNSASPPAAAAASGPNTSTSSSGTAQAAPATTTPPPGPTSKQLAADLLAVQDLPTGWASQPVSNTSSSVNACGVTKALEVHATGSAEAGFVDGNLPVLDEMLDGYRTAASAAFDTVVADVGRCGSFVTQGTKFTLRRLSFPAVGDASAAFAASGALQGLTIGVDLVLARKGTDVMVMQFVDMGAPNATQLAGFARQAVAKLPA
jgi:hypothetical protein